MSKIREEGMIKAKHTRGFCFITPDWPLPVDVLPPGRDLFAHAANFSITTEDYDNLKPGDRVSFIERKTQKGAQAEEVFLARKP